MDCPSPGLPTDLAPRRQPGPWARRLNLACRLALAAVFLMAGATKVADPHAFADRVTLHSGVPVAAASIVAAFLPWLELTCGLCLALGYAVREAAAIVAVLLVLFLGHSLYQWNDDCGCFLFPPLVERLPGWWPPMRNVLLLLCSLRAAWR